MQETPTSLPQTPKKNFFRWPLAAYSMLFLLPPLLFWIYFYHSITATLPDPSTLNYHYPGPSIAAEARQTMAFYPTLLAARWPIILCCLAGVIIGLASLSPHSHEKLSLTAIVLNLLSLLITINFFYVSINSLPDDCLDYFRSHSRCIVVALACYQVDHGSYPQHLEQIVPQYLDEPDPEAIIDPFSPSGHELYRYAIKGDRLVIHSSGFDHTYQFDPQTDPWPILGQTETFVPYLYDPTNGGISAGDMIRIYEPEPVKIQGEDE